MPGHPRLLLDQTTAAGSSMGAQAVPHLIFERQLQAAAGADEAVQPQTTPDAPVEPEQQEIANHDDGNADKPQSPQLPTSYCFSCSTQVSVVDDPRAQATLPSSSTQMPYAIQLQCTHIFCVPCMEMYINSRLNDARQGKKAFPVRCPECWTYGMDLDDSVIERVVSTETFEEWRHWKLIQSISKMYCPNPRCSEILQTPDKDCHVLESSCPVCGFEICVSCRSPWHAGMTCTQWLKSPDSLNPEDLYVRRLAKKHRWRRCPACKLVVEKTEGCNHMACRCGHHYCNQCGSEWINGCINYSTCKRWQPDDSLYAPGRIKVFMQQTATFFSQSPPRLKRSISSTFKLSRSVSKSETSTGPLSPTSDLTEEALPEGARPAWRRRASTLSFSSRKHAS